MKELLFLGGLVMSSAAFADAPSSNRSDTTADPSETICRIVANTGSRLSRTRVCMTRAQWDDYRRVTRQALEQTQSNRRPTGGN